IRPEPEEARGVGAAAHRVISRAEGAADDYGELRHLGAGHRGDHLRAVLGDALVLVLLAHHEAGDVLEEDERHLPLGAHLDGVRPRLVMVLRTIASASSSSAAKWSATPEIWV